MSNQTDDQTSFNILCFSNNPYIKRQVMATQRAVDMVLKSLGLDEQGYEIKIEGVGFACKQDVVTIHSELAALMTEKWKAAHHDMSDAAIKESLTELLFQSRDKTLTSEPLPEIDTELIGSDLVTESF